MKNTMGYGLNAFLDYDRPVDILERLLVGSEGTLAFVAEATFRTGPLKTHVATGLLNFPTLVAATAAMPGLVDCHIDLDEQGLPGRRDCPACGAPLEPGFIDRSIALAWMCPNHGMITLTPRPLDEG